MSLCSAKGARPKEKRPTGPDPYGRFLVPFSAEADGTKVRLFDLMHHFSAGTASKICREDHLRPCGTIGAEDRTFCAQFCSHATRGQGFKCFRAPSAGFVPVAAHRENPLVSDIYKFGTRLRHTLYSTSTFSATNGGKWAKIVS